MMNEYKILSMRYNEMIGSDVRRKEGMEEYLSVKIDALKKHMAVKKALEANLESKLLKVQSKK